MKRKYSYQAGSKTIEREYNYIPVRYIIAMLITVLEILAIIGIVMACCCFIPYFYLAAWATEIACVIRIIASDDNPDYKIPWLLFVLILPILMTVMMAMMDGSVSVNPQTGEESIMVGPETLGRTLAHFPVAKLWAAWMYL